MEVGRGRGWGEGGGKGEGEGGGEGWSGSGGEGAGEGGVGWVDAPRACHRSGTRLRLRLCTQPLIDRRHGHQRHDRVVARPLDNAGVGARRRGNIKVKGRALSAAALGASTRLAAAARGAPPTEARRVKEAIPRLWMHIALQRGYTGWLRGYTGLQAGNIRLQPGCTGLQPGSLGLQAG